MVNVDGDSIASAAVAFGVGWHAANRAVTDYTDPEIGAEDRLEGVEAIGVTLGHRGRKGKPLYRIRRILLTADERLTEDRFAWMQAMLTQGDPDGEVAAAWIAKELLRDVCRARDEAHARRFMISFYIWCADSDVPELRRLAGTVSRWSKQVFAYHRTGRASNGRVENTHMLAAKIRRNSHGFTNHDNYRRRLIGRLGIIWHTQPTRRIRGRQPRFIA